MLLLPPTGGFFFQGISGNLSGKLTGGGFGLAMFSSGSELRVSGGDAGALQSPARDDRSRTGLSHRSGMIAPKMDYQTAQA